MSSRRLAASTSASTNFPSQMPQPKATTAVEKTPCFLLQCPNEIIIQIASYLKPSRLSALVQASRAVNATLGPSLYKHACTSVIRLPHRSHRSFHTVLEWAASKGYAALIRGIQTQEKPEDLRESPSPLDKRIALCLAAANGHLACIEPLLAMGADVGMTCLFSSWPEHYTPVQFAAENGHPAMVELLLAKGAVPGTLTGMTALEHSILNDLKQSSYSLFNHGLSTRVEAPVVAKAYLVELASEGSFNTVRRLVENGVNIFANNSDDRAAVRYAVEHDNVKCLKALLEDGSIFGSHIVLHTTIMQMMSSRLKANATIGHIEDLSLKLAAHLGDLEAVQLLLSNGVNASAQDQAGLRPLHYAAGAALFDYNAYARVLMSYDDLEKSREDMSLRQIQVIEVLLENGACISDVDGYELTAFDHAVRLGYDNTIRYLKEKQLASNLSS